MFIIPKMIEPTTASVVVFLLSKTSNMNVKILQKRPLYYKKKICKWIKRNNHDIIEVGMDELGDMILDITNNIIHFAPHPSLYLLIYFIILIIIIIL